MQAFSSQTSWFHRNRNIVIPVAAAVGAALLAAVLCAVEVVYLRKRQMAAANTKPHQYSTDPAIEAARAACCSSNKHGNQQSDARSPAAMQSGLVAKAEPNSAIYGSGCMPSLAPVFMPSALGAGIVSSPPYRQVPSPGTHALQQAVGSTPQPWLLPARDASSSTDQHPGTPAVISRPCLPHEGVVLMSVTPANHTQQQPESSIIVRLPAEPLDVHP